MTARLQLICPTGGIQKWQARAIEQAVATGEVVVGELRLAAAAPSSGADLLLAWEKLAYRKSVDRLAVVSPPEPAGDGPADLIVDLSQGGAPGAISVRFGGDPDPASIADAVIGDRPIEMEVLWGGDVLARAVYPIVDDRTVATSMQSALARAELMLSRAILAAASGKGRCASAETPPANTRASSALDAGRFLAGGVIKRFDRLLARKEYFLAAVPRTGGVEQDLASLGERDDIHVTYAPPGYFFADPFAFEHEGQEHLFFETYDYATKRGRIDWAPVNPDGSLGPIEPVLVCDYHLSYPFVFEHEGAIYMMPETAKAGRIELYRAEEFPRCWTLVGPLIEDINAVDATLLRRDGRYWLFATVGQNGASTWDELHAFHADSLFGPWTRHAAAPLKMDARSARPAGHFIEEGGRLLRPAQDCSLGYGKALVLNEIDLLDEGSFQERTVARYTPDWMAGNSVFHTLNGSSRFWWIDGKSLPARHSGKANRSVGVFARSA